MAINLNFSLTNKRCILAALCEEVSLEINSMVALILRVVTRRSLWRLVSTHAGRESIAEDFVRDERVVTVIARVLLGNLVSVSTLGPEWMPLLGRLEVELIFNTPVLALLGIKWACFLLEKVWSCNRPWVLGILTFHG